MDEAARFGRRGVCEFRLYSVVRAHASYHGRDDDDARSMMAGTRPTPARRKTSIVASSAMMPPLDAVACATTTTTAGAGDGMNSEVRVRAVRACVCSYEVFATIDYHMMGDG